MNTLRKFAPLALLALAAISPAHAEQATEVTNKPVVATDDSEDVAGDVRKLLEDRPEIAALARGVKDKGITDAVKAQLSQAGGEKAIADALNEYLSEHPPKDGQDISDLARTDKEKAIANALKARFGKRP